MLIALLGAILALGAGSYALRFLIAFLEAQLAPPQAQAGHPPAETEAVVGGYVPAPRAPGELTDATRARVRNLLALGRSEEAVRLVRERVAVDEARARRIVAELGGADDSSRRGRELEP